MARLDLDGLKDLWYRIGDIFARKTEAGGSLSWSSPNLSLKSVAGGTLNSVNLNNGLATDAEAGHSLSFSGGSLGLKSVSGGSLSTVDLDARYATRGQAGSTLSINGRTITLSDVNGNSNGSVTVPTQDIPDVSGYATKGSVMSSASASRSGDTVTITFYDANGSYQDSVSFSVA